MEGHVPQHSAGGSPSAAGRTSLEIVAEVDERVQQVFAEAFARTCSVSSGVFEQLFRVVKASWSHRARRPTNTGIEVETRPQVSKKGSAPVTAALRWGTLADRSRVPPNVVVQGTAESVLPDGLGSRLPSMTSTWSLWIGLMEELRGTSQLLIITHQKRTMEIADSLYGVTMREGVTQVISQRMRELVNS